MDMHPHEKCQLEVGNLYFAPPNIYALHLYIHLMDNLIITLIEYLALKFIQVLV